ncbi:MAG: hypothetical protein ACR2GH_20955 [Pseudonocardia sp.]
MSLPSPTTAYQVYGCELAELLEQVLAGDLVSDWAAVERQTVRSVGALVRLQQHHRVDARGRCSICRATPRAWWPWPKRIPCTVHTALSFHLRQPQTSGISFKITVELTGCLM